MIILSFISSNSAISKLKKLTVFLDNIERKFTDIYIAAAEAVKKRRVRKYIFEPSRKIFWTVMGKEGREYIITSWISGNNHTVYACSCPDYLFRAMLKTRAEKMNRRNFCYHIVARVISEINELKKDLRQKYNKNALPTIIYLKDNSIRSFLKRFLR